MPTRSAAAAVRLPPDTCARPRRRWGGAVRWGGVGRGGGGEGGCGRCAVAAIGGERHPSGWGRGRVFGPTDRRRSRSARGRPSRRVTARRCAARLRAASDRRPRTGAALAVFPRPGRRRPTRRRPPRRARRRLAGACRDVHAPPPRGTRRAVRQRRAPDRRCQDARPCARRGRCGGGRAWPGSGGAARKPVGGMGGSAAVPAGWRPRRGQRWRRRRGGAGVPVGLVGRTPGPGRGGVRARARGWRGAAPLPARGAPLRPRAGGAAVDATAGAAPAAAPRPLPVGCRQGGHGAGVAAVFPSSLGSGAVSGPFFFFSIGPSRPILPHQSRRLVPPHPPLPPGRPRPRQPPSAVCRASPPRPVRAHVAPAAEQRHRRRRRCRRDGGRRDVASRRRPPLGGRPTTHRARVDGDGGRRRRWGGPPRSRGCSPRPWCASLRRGGVGGGGVRRNRGAGRRLLAPPVWAASMPRTTNAPAARVARWRAKGFRHAAAPPTCGASRSGDGRCVGRAANDLCLSRRQVCGPPRRRASRAGGRRSECGPSRTVQDGRQAVRRRRRRRRRCSVPLCTRRGRRVGGAAGHGRGAPRLAGGTSSGRGGGRATGECPGAPGRGGCSVL